MFRGTLWGGLLGVITSAIQGVVKDAAERAGRRVVRDAAKGGARGAAKPERPPQPSKGAAQGAGEERSSGFMSRPLWLGVGFGAVAGAGVTYVVVSQRRKEAPARVPRVVQHPAAKYGLPTSDNVLVRDGYIVAYDTRNRNPLWVLEHLTRDSVNGEGNRENSEFREDPDIDERFRAANEDFALSGYDRGHLAPAMNHKGSQAAMNATFLLTNISPQVGNGFNRHYWARFEKFVKDLTKRYNGVYVFTGPLYLPSRGADGKYEMRFPVLGTPPKMVSVPTHFFKVVLAERESSDGAGEGTRKRPRYALASFVLPNARIDPGAPLAAFAVPLESLETTAGFSFFPELLTRADREAVDEAALSWQRAGKDFARRVRGAEEPASLPVDGTEKGRTEKGRGAGTPSTSSPTSGGAVAAPGPEFYKPKHSRRGGSAVHLCDDARCELPPQDFWKRNGAGQGDPALAAARAHGRR